MSGNDNSFCVKLLYEVYIAYLNQVNAGAMYEFVGH